MDLGLRQESGLWTPLVNPFKCSMARLTRFVRLTYTYWILVGPTNVYFTDIFSKSIKLLAHLKKNRCRCEYSKRYKSFLHLFQSNIKVGLDTFLKYSKCTLDSYNHAVLFGPQAWDRALSRKSIPESGPGDGQSHIPGDIVHIYMLAWHIKTGFGSKKK